MALSHMHELVSCSSDPRHFVGQDTRDHLVQKFLIRVEGAAHFRPHKFCIHHCVPREGSCIGGKRLLGFQFWIDAPDERELLLIWSVDGKKSALRQPNIGTALGAQGIKTTTMRSGMFEEGLVDNSQNRTIFVRNSDYASEVFSMPFSKATGAIERVNPNSEVLLIDFILKPCGQWFKTTLNICGSQEFSFIKLYQLMKVALVLEFSQFLRYRENFRSQYGLAAD